MTPTISVTSWPAKNHDVCGPRTLVAMKLMLVTGKYGPLALGFQLIALTNCADISSCWAAARPITAVSAGGIVFVLVIWSITYGRPASFWRLVSATTSWSLSMRSIG